VEKELNPRIVEAKAGKRTLYFAGAAHFVCVALLGFVWSIARILIPTMSGRQRYNVPGAINAITHDLYHVINETYINALSVCDLPAQIKKFDKGVSPVTVVSDNAKYQRCEHVIQFAAGLNIELLFLPSYSPNLNIIERYWKWLRKDCLSSVCYESFDKFKEAIVSSLLKTINHSNKTELQSLLNLNFQLYDNAFYDRA
jgi:transposase